MSQTPPRFPSDPARREALKAALLVRHGQLHAPRPQRAHPWLPRLLPTAGLPIRSRGVNTGSTFFNCTMNGSSAPIHHSTTKP